MPLFGKPKLKVKEATSVDNIKQYPQAYAVPQIHTSQSSESLNAASRQTLAPTEMNPPSHTAPPRPRLIFHCQLAQGSPTGVISGFSNIREMYQKIAACYDINESEIIFCTLNSHKTDMTKLLGGQLGLDDFIFAHVKGRPKVVDIEKTNEALGLTITDNGAGYAFIKAIKEGSIIANIEGICVGDHIEKIDNESMVGLRHYEVAKRLKELPKGATFTLRVVEPLKSGFSEIGAKSGSSGQKKSGFGSGKETLRLRSRGKANVEVSDDSADIAIDKINGLLESFLGINDTELAQTIWETGSTSENPSEFSVAMEDSELKIFGFTEAFVFDLWGAISDAKQGRLKKIQDFTEQF